MKRFWLVLGALCAALGLPACLPSFPESGTLAVTPSGSGGTLVWTRASDPDEGQAVVSYRIDVDGAEVARVPAAANSCVLSGLSEGSHIVEVTAYDSVNDWSGGATSGGRVAAEVTPPEPAPAGTEIDCVAPVMEPTGSIVVDDIAINAEVAPGFGVELNEPSTSAASPDGVNLLVDALAVRITGLEAGGVGEAYLDLATPMDTAVHLVDDGWEELPYDDDTGVRVAGDGATVTITARDGGRGDDDGVADGAVSISLGLGLTEEAAGAANPPLELEQSLPQTAPGWIEARPAIATITPSGSWLPRLLVVFRINSAGALQYAKSLNNIGAGLGIPLDDFSPWTEWITVSGTGELIGSPSASSASSLLARGVDGRLKRITNSSATLEPTGSWTVTDLPPLPNGLTIAGSPASGGSTILEGSDGGLWSLSGSEWTMILNGELRPDGPVTVNGTDMWLHDADHLRHRVTYTSDSGWLADESELQDGIWAGSPASLRLMNGPKVVAGISSTGSIVTEISQGIEGTFSAGTGFVGSPAVVPFGPNGALAAVRADGHVTVMTLSYQGMVTEPQYWYTIGQPSPPTPKSPANGAFISPGSDATMTADPADGATDYRWTLFESPLSGTEAQVVTETIAGSAGTNWTVPASTLRNGVRYRWQVEAFRSDTGLYKKSNQRRYFTVTDGRAPELLAPLDGADVTVGASGSTTLTTGVVPGATSYRFTLARNGSTQSQDVPCCASGATSVAWTVPDGWIVPGGTYSWSVQAVFSGTAGSPGASRSFTAITTGGAPSTPALVSPGAGANVGSGGSWVDLTAQSPTNGHVREFRFELWEHVAGTRTWVVGHNSPATHSSPTVTWAVPPGTLQANRTYEWTVRVYDYATRQLSGWPQPRLFSTTTDTLTTDAVLLAGNELRSSNGYRLAMQTDGNLVVYRPDGSVQAATNRFARGVGAYLVMQGDGNLVEYYNQGPSSRKVVWASGSRGSGAYLVMQTDGNAVVYRRNANGTRTAVWASNSLIPPPPIPGPAPAPPGPGPRPPGDPSPPPAGNCSLPSRLLPNNIRSAMDGEATLLFSFAKRPGWGCVATEANIPSKYVSAWPAMEMRNSYSTRGICITLSGCVFGLGDNRVRIENNWWPDWDPNFDPAKTRFVVVLNFDTGMGWLVLNESKTLSVNCVFNVCNAAGPYAISAKAAHVGWGGAHNWLYGGFDPDGAFRLYVSAKNSVSADWLPGSPAIDISLRVTASDLSMWGDSFPDVSTYRYRAGKVQARHNDIKILYNLCDWEAFSPPNFCSRMTTQTVERRTITSQVVETASSTS